MFGIGVPELILILVVGLIVFGPGKLPEAGRALGKGLREFKKASNALSQALNAPDPPAHQGMEAAARQAAQPASVSQANSQEPAAAQGAQEEKPASPAYQPPTQDSVREQLAAKKTDKDTDSHEAKA